MLSVGKLAAGPTAGRYYEDAVAQGREDYYWERDGHVGVPGVLGDRVAKTLSLGYTHVMRLQEGDRERLKALVNGGGLAPNGTGAPANDPNNAPADVCQNDETPADAGASFDSWGETRTR